MSTIEKAVEKLERERAASRAAESADGTRMHTLEKVAEDPDLREGTSKSSPSNTTIEHWHGATDSPAEAEKIRRTNPAEQRAEAREIDRVPASVLELPIAELANKGMVTPVTPRSRIAEEFRTIKRPLLRNVDRRTDLNVKYANLIMVTSALQGDGKTFTALNLAMSIAMEQDKTVLFVDADVAKASAGTLLGIPKHSPGLIDVLERKGVALEDTILNTSIENLRVLPAGNSHERANELLASRGMHDLMVELSERYPDRVVVFDSPPLLLTTEASVLASFMGQIAFVASTDETPQDAITEALEHLGGDKIIGMVLNKAHRRRSKLLGLGSYYGSYGYQYGYGYGYGYGHRESNENPEPDKQ